jgi:hypothetical protein
LSFVVVFVLCLPFGRQSGRPTKDRGQKTKDNVSFAPVAQLAEQGTLNPKVEGSIPSGRILIQKAL